MDLDDRMSIVTAEGVVLEVTLAGVASRYGAALIDLLIQGVAIVAIVFGLGLAASTDAMEGSGGVFAAVGIVAIFLLLVGYPTFFEVLDDGRSPGKRALGIQVRTLSGGPVNFVASMIRNFLRLIDLLPGFAPLVGIVAILCTARHQRLGDLAAGTVVVRQARRPVAAVAGTPSARGGADPTAPLTPVDPAAIMGWDVSTVTAHDVVILRHFLTRRFDLLAGPRHQLATELATRTWPKVAGAPQGIEPERFVELVVAAKAQRGSQSATGRPASGH